MGEYMFVLMHIFHFSFYYTFIQVGILPSIPKLYYEMSWFIDLVIQQW
jgi:hypothetical protein